MITEPTPNPNALKFISDKQFKNEGSSNYSVVTECGNNELAKKLFFIKGVDRVYIRENTVTVTKFHYIDWEEVEPKVISSLEESLKTHDPNYEDHDPEKERRESLPPELQKIETILDDYIRPALRNDGGDVQTVSLEGKVLKIKYQGACGNCPSSAGGTLNAIRAFLQDEYDPDIEVYID